MQCEYCGNPLIQMYSPFTIDCPKCRENGIPEFPEKLTLPPECKPYEKEMKENWVSEATQGTEFAAKKEVRRGEIGTSEWFEEEAY